MTALPRADRLCLLDTDLKRQRTAS
jgi:hypothetical protein